MSRETAVEFADSAAEGEAAEEQGESPGIACRAGEREVMQEWVKRRAGVRHISWARRQFSK